MKFFSTAVILLVSLSYLDATPTPLQIVNGPKDIKTGYGSSATFKCDVQGGEDLPITITWIHNGNAIDFDNETSLVKSADNSLTINEPRPRHSGTYTCVAETKHSQDVKAATLQVIEPLEAPTNFKLKDILSPTTALVAWNAVTPDSIRGHSSGYKIKIWSENKFGHTEMQISPTAQSALLSRLVPYEKNYAQIYVYNGKYNGPPSETISFVMPEDVPSKIPSVDVHLLGASALYLKWRKPEYSNGVLTGYNIYFAVTNGTTIREPIYKRTPSITDPNQLQAKVSGLMPNTVYRVYLTAVNAAGESSRYTTEIRTGPSEYSEPSVPNFAWKYFASENNLTALKITWLPNFDGNPGRDFYVKYKKENDSIFVETQLGMFEDYIVIEGLELAEHVYEFVVVAVDGKYQTQSAVQKLYVAV